MSIAPKSISAGELASRVAARPGRGDWLVLLAPESEVAKATSEVTREIEVMAEAAPARIESPADATALTERLAETSTAIVSGLDHFAETEWQHLDLLRSRLQRDQPVIMILSTPAFERLMRGAHLHPGSDDLSVPSPLMSPLEILDVILHGLALPEKPRASGKAPSPTASRT